MAASVYVWGIDINFGGKKLIRSVKATLQFKAVWGIGAMVAR
jgi:hypothetical protein